MYACHCACLLNVGTATAGKHSGTYSWSTYLQFTDLLADSHGVGLLGWKGFCTVETDKLLLQQQLLRLQPCYMQPWC
jgi:hypothetical protein